MNSVLETRVHPGAYVVSAVLDNPLHLFVDELNASDGGFQEPLDLPLGQKLEGHFRNEQGRSGARRVPDGREDVHWGEASQWVNGILRNRGNVGTKQGSFDG